MYDMRMGAYERLTVNLTQRSAEALAKAAELSGDTKTDTVNRALQTYAFIREAVASGGTVLVRTSDSQVEAIKFL